MKKPVYLYILFSLLFVYLVLRAIYVPLLHDEISTFFRFVHVGKFIPYYSEWTTNNHFLNSLFTFFSYKLFGTSPIAQRLPNLLFIPVFFWFLFKLSLEIRSTMLRWAFILIILSFHNFIDFFSFSRGYGMSITMLSGAILFAMNALKFNRTSDYIYSLLFMLISVSAILIMINSYIIIIGLLALNTIYHNHNSVKKMLRHLLILISLGVIPVILVVEYLFDLNQVGRLDYGGMEGFWEVSVKNLTNLLVGSFSGYLNAFIVVLFSLMFFLYFYLLRINNGNKLFSKL